MESGYIQIYTGAGKGKTTAAIGLAIRALGAGHRVCFMQFMKMPIYHEHRILSTFAPQLLLQTWGQPCFIATKEQLAAGLEKEEWTKGCVVFEKGHPPAEYVSLLQEGMAAAEKAVTEGQFDLVILDEINMAMYFELVDVQQVENLLRNKSVGTEVVLTGRGCPERIMALADLVTKMQEIKHYYTQGVPARDGIEQ